MDVLVDWAPTTELLVTKLRAAMGFGGKRDVWRKGAGNRLIVCGRPPGGICINEIVDEIFSSKGGDEGRSGIRSCGLRKIKRRDEHPSPVEGPRFRIRVDLTTISVSESGLFFPCGWF